MSKRRIGRLNVEFEKIEEFASKLERDDPSLFRVLADWELTRHSAVYRCKDGSLTICLVWHGKEPKATMTRTIRGVWPEAA